ncbi:hypothetical protein SFRURICE_005426 [Spodoptera frugiperda]|nr:hypothetical protein SFRURICE_005426 [Spodoptera frugiperda]
MRNQILECGPYMISKVLKNGRYKLELDARAYGKTIYAALDKHNAGAAGPPRASATDVSPPVARGIYFYPTILQFYSSSNNTSCPVFRRETRNPRAGWQLDTYLKKRPNLEIKTFVGTVKTIPGNATEQLQMKIF